MTLHLLKLCVGISDPSALEWAVRGRGSRSSHVTRMTPSRGDDLLDGGSLYWVMSGLISARQRIDGLESFSDSDGIRRCRIVLDGRIVRVRPTPHRAFQGWRYFRASDVPPDLDSGDGVGSLPDGLRAELASLGLLS